MTPREVSDILLKLDSPIDVAGVLDEAAEVINNPSLATAEERRQCSFVLRWLGELFKRHA